MAFPTISTGDTQSGTVTSNSTSWTGTYPTNLANGDLILLFVGADGSGIVNSLPAGWIFDTASNGSNVSLSWAKKKSDGTETGTFTIGISASEQGCWTTLRIPSGTWEGTLGTTFSNDAPDSGAVVASTVLGQTGTSTAPDSSTLNPANWDIEDTLWLSVAAADHGNTTFTNFPATYALYQTPNESGGSNGASLGYCGRESDTASQDPAAMTIDVSEQWIARTIAIRPAGAGGATTARGFAQAQAEIKQTYRSHAQSQARIKQTYNGFAQSQSQIKQTYRAHAQANALIAITVFSHAQVQARIKNTYFGLAQAQGSIKQTYRVHAQSQADIKQTYRGFAQANALIAKTSFVHAQAQGTIKATSYGFGQSQAQIKQMYQGYGQANASISGAAQVFAQAQAQIKQSYLAHAQSQALIKNTYQAFAQAQAWIENTYQGYGQAQAWLVAVVNSSGQAQAFIRVPSYGFAQAQALIAGTVDVLGALVIFDRSSTGVTIGDRTLEMGAEDQTITLALSDRNLSIGLTDRNVSLRLLDRAYGIEEW